MTSVSIRGASVPAAASGPPAGAAFDIVLIFHVGCLLIGLASLLVTGIQAWRARGGSDAPGAPSVARYFRPGINWPGRVLYLLLVFGFVLVGMSGGVYGFGDPFVQVGLVLWIVAVSTAEMVVWPGERSLQAIISGHVVRDAASRGAGEPAADQESPQRWAPNGEARDVATRVALFAWAVCAVLVAATVVMVQKP